VSARPDNRYLVLQRNRENGKEKAYAVRRNGAIAVPEFGAMAEVNGHEK
jgi:hypothetical protein